MGAQFMAGDAVQTPFGKGVVREVRNHGQLLVQIQQRTLLMAGNTVSRLAQRPSRGVAQPLRDAAPELPGGPVAAREIDLHGLSVEEALERVDEALDAALLAGLAELRVIHGRSGGRIRHACHERLRAIAAVRSFRLDFRNAGVTIVAL